MTSPKKSKKSAASKRKPTPSSRKKAAGVGAAAAAADDPAGSASASAALFAGGAPAPILVLDSGGWTVKHGVVTTSRSDGGHRPPAASAPSAPADGAPRPGDASRDEFHGRPPPPPTAAPPHPEHGPTLTPNATGRPRHQLAVLVGDEIETTVKNKSQLEMTRPLERGYCTNLGCQLRVWRRVLRLNDVLAATADVEEGKGAGGAGKKASSKKARLALASSAATSLTGVGGTMTPAVACGCLLLVQPFSPSAIEENVDQVAFRDLGFGAVAKLLVQCMAAHRYLEGGGGACAHEGGAAAGAGAGASSTMRPPDGTKCCCVVDSGFSVTHVVPTFDAKAVECAIRRVNVGGKLLTNRLKELVTYRQWNMMDEFPIVNEAKEMLCFVSTNFDAELDGARRERVGSRWFDRDFVLPDFVSTFEGSVMLPQALLVKEQRREEEERGNRAASKRRGEGAGKGDEAAGEGATDENVAENNNGPPSSGDADADADAGNEKVGGEGGGDGDGDGDSDEETDEQRFLRIQRRKDEERRRRELIEQERQVLSMSTERFAVPEVLFRPSDVGLDQVGVVEAVVQAVEACDPSLRAAMYRNVLLVGGNARLPGYRERIEAELRSLAPCNYEVGVSTPPDPVEFAWRGARDFAARPGFVERFCVDGATWEKAKKRGGGQSVWRDKYREFSGEDGLTYI